MHEKFRTPERHRFIKGIITQISDVSVSIIPYGENNEVKGFYVPEITEFWKGGLNHISEVSGRPGDQGTMSAFVDDSGKLLVETLYVNHKKDILIIQRQESTGLSSSDITLKFHKNAVTFDDIPVEMDKISVGQSVIAQGEMIGPNLLDVYRIEVN